MEDFARWIHLFRAKFNQKVQVQGQTYIHKRIHTKNLEINLQRAIYLLEVLQKLKGSHMFSVWMCVRMHVLYGELCVFLCLCECVCVYNVCTWLICCLCVMPVTGAITLSPRPLPAAEAVPGGGRRQLEGEDGRNTLQSWSNDTAMQSLSTLCLRTSHYVSTAVQMGGYATSITHSKSEQVWISTLPIRWFVSKCSLKVFDFCSHFSLSYRKAHTKGCVWKSIQITSVSGLLLSQRSRLCWSIAVWANNAIRWSILFVSGSLVLGKQASKDEWCHTTCIQGVFTVMMGNLWIYKYQWDWSQKALQITSTPVRPTTPG